MTAAAPAFKDAFERPFDRSDFIRDHPDNHERTGRPERLFVTALPSGRREEYRPLRGSRPRGSAFPLRAIRVRNEQLATPSP
ncbi:MAG: hypothetical protein M3303_08305 [Gemmatimonadota bacterium]|nr:hypothetical protein [Gemmatimonadota bacterium]